MYKKNSLNLWKTIGFIGFSIYVFLTYIPQILLHKFFYNEFEVLYNGTHNSPLFVILTIIIFFSVVNILDVIYPHISIKIKQQNLIIFGNLLSTVMVLLLFLSSLYFYKNFGLNFRQTKSLSDGGVIVQVLWFLRFAGEFYVFYSFASILNGNKITFFTKLKLFIVVLSWILTLTGSLQFPFIIFGLIMIFTPDEKFKNFFIKNLYIKKSLLKIFLFIVLSFFIIIMAVFIGFANKIGFDKALDMFSDLSLLHTIISHVALRLSTSYISVLFMINDHLFDISLEIKTYLDSFHTFLSRLSSIVPIFKYQLDGFESVNRTNYLLLFIPNFHERAGASPGILASIYYLPLFPVNFILMGSYVVLIIRSINKYISVHQNRITFLGKLVITYLIYPLFESPLNMLTIIEPAFFYFLIFIVMSYFPPIKYKV